MSEPETPPADQTAAPSPEETSVTEMMRDAQLVEEYATSCGLLKNDDFLIALENARKVQKDGELEVASSEYRVLRSELNKVMRCIYPVNILDLREWNPLHPRQLRPWPHWPGDATNYVFNRMSNAVIAVLAVLIFLFTGFYTVWSQRAELLITEARVLEEQDRVELERKYLTWLIGRIVQRDRDDDAQLAAFWVEGASHLDAILSFEQQVRTLTKDIEATRRETYPLQTTFDRVSRYICYKEVVPDPDPSGKDGADGRKSAGQTLPPPGATGPVGPPSTMQFRFGMMKMICTQPQTIVGRYAGGGGLGSIAASPPATATPTVPGSGGGNPTSGDTPSKPINGTNGSDDPVVDAVATGTGQAALRTGSANGSPPLNTYGSDNPFERRDPEECERDIIRTLKDIELMLGSSPPEELTEGYPEIFFDVGLRTELIENIRCARMRGSGGAIQQPTIVRSHKVENASDLERRFRVVSKWTLPSLYGALGAMVYTLGFMLSRIHPDPKFFRSVVRLMMGSLAGVTIVNFFTPEIANMVYLPVKSFGLLAIAFLAGFSVEVVLELLRGLVTRWSERVSAGGSNG